jgi:hypothetical protein
MQQSIIRIWALLPYASDWLWLSEARRRYYHSGVPWYLSSAEQGRTILIREMPQMEKGFARISQGGQGPAVGREGVIHPLALSSQALSFSALKREILCRGVALHGLKYIRRPLRSNLRAR